MKPRTMLAAAIVSVGLLCACGESSPKSAHDGSSSPKASARTSAHISDAMVAAYQTPIGDQTVLDGVWRMHARRADMLAAGADAKLADSNAGTWTFAIHSGLAHVKSSKGGHCVMQFVFSKGRKVFFNAEVDNRCGGNAIGTYKRDGRTVTFKWFAALDENAGKWTSRGAPFFNAFFQRGMTRVGDG